MSTSTWSSTRPTGSVSSSDGARPSGWLWRRSGGSPRRAPVLLLGEPGAGIELFARTRQGAVRSATGRSRPLDLFGGLEDSLVTAHLYQAGGRFVMDVQGLFWKPEYMGVNAGYFWTDNFSGRTLGAEVSFAF